MQVGMHAGLVIETPYWPRPNSDTVGEFSALPATACGRSIKGGLNDPMKGDPGKFGREHRKNMEFANSIDGGAGL
jgi:hypothetical protein